MSTTLNRSALQLDIDITPYFSGRHQVLMMHEGTDGFEEAVRAMADECNLHLYRGILYNMPYKIDFPPPYYYVLQGYYIGVFTSYIWCVYWCCWGAAYLLLSISVTRKDIESDVLGSPNAIYFCVDSLEVGEKKVRLAIEQGEAVNLGPYHFAVRCSSE